MTTLPDSSCCHACGRPVHPQAVQCRWCDAATGVVCPTAPRPMPRRRGLTMVLLAIGLTSLMAVTVVLYLWVNRVAYLPLEEARTAVATLERDGLLRQRTCGPNRAFMPAWAWNAAPSAGSRDALLVALARLCVEEGTGPEMQLFDPDTGRALATFNGRYTRIH